MIQSGKLKPIGLAGDKRNPALPNLPLLGEHPSLKGFEHTVWSALLASPRTPESVVTRLTEAMNEWIASPENLARITANASRRLDPMSVMQNAAFLKSEQEKYRRLARSLRIEPQ
jgi:tripartite-type tricarboxylate transporter receptor subunit TctC